MSAAATRLSVAFSDAQLEAILQAMGSFEVHQIQGFRYGSRLVIRDCLRPYGQQEIWEGVADRDEAIFYRRCEVERLRLAIARGLAASSDLAPPATLLDRGK